jgi:hypothetical protein
MDSHYPESMFRVIRSMLERPAGDAAFVDGSPDVKVEGLNVCRHTDLMTHNHG